MANLRIARRSGLVLRGGRQRRESVWVAIPFAQTTLNSAGGTIISTMNAAFIALRPFTIIRTRVELLLRSDQSAVAAEFQSAAYGEAVVTEQALGIGVTAVPTPVTDLGSDAFYLHQILFAGHSIVTQETNPVQTFSVDSRAMRKVGENDELYGVGEFSSITQGTVLLSAGRQLIKLH